MTAGRRIIPQPGERWLLRDGGRCYALPASLGRRLRDGEAVPGLDAALADASPPPAGRSLWFGLPLIPARLVVAMAAGTAPAASWGGLCAAALVGAVGYVLTRGAPAASARWPILAAGLLVAGLVHELGHAAALARGGGRPGVIGVGAMFVFPVLFCDVTAAALLPRADRMRVDAAGVAWHLAAGGALATAGAVGNQPAFTLASWGVLAAASWSVLPFLRTDGYWLLCDLLGVETLESPAPSDAGPGRRLVFGLWRLGSLAFLGVIAAALAGRARWLFVISAGWGAGVRLGGLGLLVILLGVVSFGLARRARVLILGLHEDVIAMYIQCRYTFWTRH